MPQLGISIPAAAMRRFWTMLAHSHGQTWKTALYGWNPMAINLAQFQALAMRMLSLAKLVAERDRQVRRELENGWERLVSEARALPR